MTWDGKMLIGGNTGPSGADLSAKRGYWAKTPAAWVVAGDDDGVGVIVDGGAASGDHVGVAKGYVEVLFGGTVAVDDYITSDASGLTVAAGSGKHPRGWAVTGGAVGEWGFIWAEKPADEAIA